MGKKMGWLAMASMGAVLVAGCGKQATPTGTQAPSVSASSKASAQPSSAKSSTARPTKVYCYQCQNYAGTKNLDHWVALAKANPNNAKDQFNAGLAENVNHHPQAAMSYFKTTAKLDPKDGIALNDIGNLYRNQKDLKTAVQYYQKATQVQPSYDYGWYNWMLAEQSMGNQTKAKAIAAQAIKVLPSNDQLYPLLKKGAQ